MSPVVLQEWFVRAAFAVVGAVHLLPATGLLGRAVLERAYGVTLPSGDLLVLMQHRALLFGLLGVACGLAVAWPDWRQPVGVAVLVSMAGFVAVAQGTAHGAAVQRVVWVDLALLPLMGLALLLVWRLR